MTEQNGNAFPSVSLAYKIAVDSYDVILRRLDGVDGRIQSIIALSITVMALSPALATARHLSFNSWTFILGGASAFLILILGSFARLSGKFLGIDPNCLPEWMQDDQIQFQRSITIYAGEAFSHNQKLLRRNWWFSFAVNVLFFLEVIFLVVWAAAASV
jgi:hypothetical protein